jgi:uncharacterized OB-fold protein
MMNATSATTTATPRPLPQPTDATRPYWEGAAQGRLMVQHCAACDRHQFYPRLFCTVCLSDAMQWVESKGQGTVYSYTVNHRGPTPFFKPRTPYVVAMIDLDEGVRMMANILDCDPKAVKIGARVRVKFEPVSDTLALPQFTLIST